MGKIMTKQSRQELLARIKPQYKAATRKQKQKIIDDMVTLCEYDRKYAIRLLNKPEAVVPPVTIVRKRKYGEGTKQALSTLWYAANQICSKRLVPFLPELIENMENNGHIELAPDMRAALFIGQSGHRGSVAQIRTPTHWQICVDNAIR